MITIVLFRATIVLLLVNRLATELLVIRQRARASRPVALFLRLFARKKEPKGSSLSLFRTKSDRSLTPSVGYDQRGSARIIAAINPSSTLTSNEIRSSCRSIKIRSAISDRYKIGRRIHAILLETKFISIAPSTT